jgi:hypothetical protein
MGKRNKPAQPPAAIRSRIVGEGMEAPDQLLANPQNWRRHPKEQLDALEGLLSEVGWVQRVIVNRTTGHLVDGHARVELALRRDEPQVPVLYVDLSADEERMVLASLDPIGGLATTDQAMLDDLLGGLEAGNEALGEFLAGLRGSPEVGGNTDPDNVPQTPADPVSRLGDAWVLGRHRIVCGDCTDPLVVDKALAGVKPHLMVTDPPYGVDYDPTRTSNNAKKAGKVLNDDRADWREAWLLFPGDVAYVWHAGLRAREVVESLEACGFAMRAQIIWAKDRMTLGRGHYHFQHEPCWYAVRKGGTGHWEGGAGQDNGVGNRCARGRGARTWHAETSRVHEAPDREQQQPRPGGVRAVQRQRHDDHRGRDDRPMLPRDRAEPVLRRRGGEAVAGLHWSDRHPGRRRPHFRRGRGRAHQDGRLT